jgi:hypothetical protein
MKPTREGYWFYKGDPAKVIKHGDVEMFPDCLPFFVAGKQEELFVEDTEDHDWGPEIVFPCENRQSVCIEHNLLCSTARVIGKCCK